jgi:hypothetical protein
MPCSGVKIYQQTSRLYTAQKISQMKNQIEQKDSDNKNIHARPQFFAS